MAVMKALYVTECDARIMCDRRDKGTNDKCNIFMMRCDDGYDESIMRDGV